MVKTGDLANSWIEFNGCSGCMAIAIAEYLLVQPQFKNLINKAIRIANERTAQKEN